MHISFGDVKPRLYLCRQEPLGIEAGYCEGCVFSIADCINKSTAQRRASATVNIRLCLGFHHLLAGGDAERFDDFVEVSLHNRIELVEGQVNPVVGYAVLRSV